MDTIIMALCELSNDLLYHKIPADQLLFYAEESLRLGTEAARKLIDKSIEELYEEHKIKITCKEDGTAAFDMSYRGQIILAKEGCSVVIFESSIKALADHSRSDNINPLSYEEAKQIHLAHEFFHYLEFQSGQYVSQLLPPVTTLNFLGLKRKARINRCSEIAAHAFAKELLALETLPNYYDYIYLINTGKMTREGFDTMKNDKKNILSTKRFCPSLQRG